MAEFLGNKTIGSQFLGNKVILRTYKGDNLINEYEPLYNPPSDWSDIRTDCPNNSIALYAGESGTNYVIENGVLTWANPNIYLQSSGTQYIDTDIIANGNTGIETKYDISNYQMLFGARTSFANNCFNFFRESGCRFDYNNKSYITTNTGDWNLPTSGTFLSYPTENGYYFQTKNSDGEIIYGTTPIGNFETPANMCLFACNTNGTVSGFSTSKIYYFKIYNEGVLVRHFVPVPSGLVIGDFTCPSAGMFDIVNQEFYGNSGTGSFTYGKNTDYNNLGFTATCTGGYNVYIDGTQYGTTYASGATCSITWSTSGITTGDDITTPSALKAHKIWIEPATSGNNITAFSCARVAASGEEQQGILWAHLNLSNEISLGGNSIDYTEARGAFGRLQTYSNKLMKALTAKNNTIKISKLSSIFYNTSSLEYSAILDCSNNTISFYGALWNSGLKSLTIKNAKPLSMQYFAMTSDIETLKFVKSDFSSVINLSGAFLNARYIKKLPDFNFSTPCVGGGEAFINNCSALTNDVILDLSNCTALNKFIATSTSRFKGLRVSNESPFSGTAPQINVSYTGMDRSALVQLFNDLPYNVGYTVVGSPIINNGVVSGFSSSDYLTVANFEQYKPFEFVLKINTGTRQSDTCYIIRSNGLLLYWKWDYKLGFFLRNTDNVQIEIDSTTQLLANKDYWVKMKYDGSIMSLYLSEDGNTYNLENSQIISVISMSYLTYIGTQKTSGAIFNGSIDLNNTYIKVNDVYWFRGQPAMTKTLSCVGATGTADLTQSDKDIALNKGWSLTLS